jgi:hypothetical protein
MAGTVDQGTFETESGRDGWADALDRLIKERQKVEDLQREVDRLRELVTLKNAALTPFASFIHKYDEKKMRGLDDTIYQIHAGTPWEAELKASDCRRASKALGTEFNK